MNAIQLDAYRGYDDEPWRIERLELLRDIIKYHADFFCDPKVLALYDCKGNFAVNWSQNPTSEQMEMLNGFIENVLWENAIDHFVRGKQITDNCDWDGGPF
jgi:hypothetical protein